jgi:hypothetical protein
LRFMKTRMRLFGGMLALVLGLCATGSSRGGQGWAESPAPGVAQARAAAVATPSLDPSVAQEASGHNLDALGVGRLRELTGASGLGQTLCIVDTGTDPRVFGGSGTQAPDRVLDWIDQTGEGNGVIVGRYKAESGVVNLQEIPLNVNGVRSRSGDYIVGVLPDVVTARMGPNRQVYFVVFDPEAAGLYNHVAIDTDTDLDFSDEAFLREFRNNRSYAVIDISPEQSIGVVLSRLDVGKGLVSFGFDLNGHGTGLGALAAGSGALSGAAPEARVVIVKALASDGLGNWTNIEKGIEQAILAKATVVLVGSARQQAGDDPEWERLQTDLSKMGSHLVLPVGNAGPGVGTITVVPASDTTVLVSGYLPQKSAELLLGQDYGDDAWYPLSSCGPDPEGNRGPLVAAPAIAPAPAFRGDGTLVFSNMEGTSVSAAYAAGCLALIRQTQVSTYGELMRPASFITASLSQGAVKMLGVLPVEQGNGRLDIAGAFQVLSSRPDHRRMLFVGTWEGLSSSDGIWAKGVFPGAFPVWVDNYAPVARIVSLSSDAPWLKMRGDLLFMEPVSQRDTVVYGADGLTTGFHCGEITADDANTTGIDTSFVVSVSIPHQFNPSGKASFELRDAASLSRQFIKMPESSESLTLTLVGSGPGQQYALYSPDGYLVRQGSLVGSVTVRVGLPKPGLWQLSVYNPGGEPLDTPVKVQASLEGFFGFELGSTLESQYYLVGTPGSAATVRPAASTHGAEWRYRSSFTQETGRSTQIMLPDIAEGSAALSVRFGGASGNVLRAYLMRFDMLSSRWNEVGRALTTNSGVGEIHLPNPIAGKYTVHIEAYGAGPRAYVEVDMNLLSGGAGISVAGVPRSISAGSSTLEVPLPKGEDEPLYLVVLRQSDSKVIGVLERSQVDPAEIPIVQVSMGSDIKTVRAFRRADLKPADVLVTIGGVSYQLSGGRVTAPIPDGLPPSYRTKDGTRVLLIPPDRAS